MHVAVLGLGTFGTRVAEVLARRGVDVLAIDSDARRVEALKDRVTAAMAIDATDETALRRAGAADVDCAIVAVGANIESNILMTSVLRRLGVERVIARCDTPVQAAVLREVGASRTLLLEHLVAEQLAEELAAPHLLTRRQLESGHVLADVRAPEPVVGRSLSQLDLRRRFGVTIIAIKRRRPALTADGRNTWSVQLIDAPGPGETIESEDVLLVIGMDSGIGRMIGVEPA